MSEIGSKIDALFYEGIGKGCPVCDDELKFAMSALALALYSHGVRIVTRLLRFINEISYNMMETCATQSTVI